MVFFALDFATRKKNQLSGEFFVEGFFKEGPKTLEELQAEIADGNTQWLERLCYYYWTQQDKKDTMQGELLHCQWQQNLNDKAKPKLWQN